MRGAEIKTLIRTVVEAIIPDDAASVADRFTFIDEEERSTVEATGDRQGCRLLQGPLEPSTTFGPQTRRVGLRLVVPYTSAPGVGDRILADGELITTAVYALHGGDLHAVEIGDWIPVAAEADNRVECTLDIFATYNLTGV